MLNFALESRVVYFMKMFEKKRSYVALATKPFYMLLAPWKLSQRGSDGVLRSTQYVTFRVKFSLKTNGDCCFDEITVLSEFSGFWFDFSLYFMEREGEAFDSVCGDESPMRVETCLFDYFIEFSKMNIEGSCLNQLQNCHFYAVISKSYWSRAIIFVWSL